MQTKQSNQRTTFRFKFRKEYSFEYIERCVNDHNNRLTKNNEEADTAEIEHEYNHNILCGKFLDIVFKGDTIVRFICTGATGSGLTFYRCVMVDAKYSTNKKFMV